MPRIQIQGNAVYYGLVTVLALGTALSGYAAAAAGQRSAAALENLRAARSEASALRRTLAAEEKAAAGVRDLPANADAPRFLTEASDAAHAARVELVSVSFGPAVAPGATGGPPASYLPVSLDIQGARGAVLSCLLSLRRTGAALQVIRLQFAPSAGGAVNANAQCRLFFGGNGP